MDKSVPILEYGNLANITVIVQTQSYRLRLDSSFVKVKRNSVQQSVAFSQSDLLSTEPYFPVKLHVRI